MNHQNLTGGTIYGMWAGANTPSSSLGQTYSSGAAIGQETNVGNRWADFGLLNDIGVTRYTIGHLIAPDVLPSSDGTTAAIYPGSFAEVITRSVGGHKWWTGLFINVDSIVANGTAVNVRGGSVIGNAPGVILKADGYFVRGLDFSGVTFTTPAIYLGANHAINWGGSSMNGTATTFGLSTGAGTGDGGLYGNNYGSLCIQVKQQVFVLGVVLTDRESILRYYVGIRFEFACTSYQLFYYPYLPSSPYLC